MNRTPVRVEPFNQWEMLFTWNTGELYHVPYVELRFHCPCAGCVDEMTGQRTIRRESVSNDVRPTDVHVVGRYALQITWSDGHQTGMYHFDRLWQLCQEIGKPVPMKAMTR